MLALERFGVADEKIGLMVSDALLTLKGKPLSFQKADGLRGFGGS